MTRAPLKLAIGLFVLVLIIGNVYLHKQMWINMLVNISSLDGWMCLCLLSIIYIISTMLLLPFGLFLNLLAGMLWGTLWGALVINFLGTLVAGISFYLGRWFGHYFLDDLFKKYAALAHMKSMINRYDWQFISLARLNPIVPFGLSNYVFGTIPELSFKHYIIITAVTNLIPCLAFASIGSVFKIFTLTNGNIQQLIFAIGIALLLLSTLFVLKVVLIEKEVS